MMQQLCVRLVRRATLKVPKDKTGATQIFQILINRTTTWLDFMEVEEKRRQVQIRGEIDYRRQSRSTWTVKLSSWPPRKVNSAPIPSFCILRSHYFSGNIRGWFLETSNTQNSAAVVLYLHGVSATRAYPPRVSEVLTSSLNVNF